MAFPAVKRIRTQRTIKLDSLEQSAEWLRRELAGVATDVALEENRVQMALGNDPTRIVLDGRRAIELDEQDANRLKNMDNVVFADFKRSIRIFYTSVEVLAEAFEATWNNLEALVPKGKTRRGINSMSFWCSDISNRGRSREFRISQAGKVKEWILESRSDTISISIQGPRTEYRRSMIYQGRNRPGRGGTEYLAPRPTTGDPLLRFSGMGRRGTVTERRKTVMRGRYAGRVVAQYLLNQAIHKIVKRRMQRQFRDVYFSYRFIPNPPGGQELPIYNTKSNWEPDGPNVHIPSLGMWIRQRFRGGRGRLR